MVPCTQPGMKRLFAFKEKTELGRFVLSALLHYKRLTFQLQRQIDRQSTELMAPCTHPGMKRLFLPIGENGLMRQTNMIHDIRIVLISWRYSPKDLEGVFVSILPTKIQSVSVAGFRAVRLRLLDWLRSTKWTSIVFVRRNSLLSCFSRATEIPEVVIPSNE